jgi:phosphoserine phosphatase
MAHHINISKAIQTGRSTLSGRAMALLLSADGCEEHPLKEVAKKNPRFFMDIAEIVEARRHLGSDIRIPTGGINIIVEKVYKITRPILEVINNMA